MSIPLRGSLAAVAALCLAMRAVPAPAISDPAGLCAPAADPCVVGGTVFVDDGVTLDLGARTLEIAPSGRLEFGAGTIAITAGGLLIRANGRMVGPGGRLTVTLTGAVQVESQARIDVAGDVGGFIALNATGDATIAGTLDATALGEFDGGLVTVSGAAVTLPATARVLVAGGGNGAGGGVALLATGPLVVDAPITGPGGQSGGAVECEGQSVLLNGRIDVSGGPGGAGAVVDVRARGPVTINGVIDGDARGGVVTGGGLGAEVAILAPGPVELNGAMMLSGGGPGGEGGLLDVVTNAGIVQRGAITARGNGAEGFGGEVRLAADGDLTVGDIDVGGGFAGNRIVLASGGVLRMTGTLEAEPSSGLGFGGVIEATTCALDMDTVARISTLGAEGATTLTGRGSMVLRGTLVSGGANAFVIRDAAAPPVLLGTVTPAPSTTVDATLEPCTAVPAPGSTTTTTVPAPPPGECADPALSTYDAILCRLSAIRLALDERPDLVGGNRPARGLGRRVSRALRAVEIARSGRRVPKKLRAASRQVGRFLGAVERGLERGRIDPALGARLLDLGTTASVGIEGLRIG